MQLGQSSAKKKRVRLRGGGEGSANTNTNINVCGVNVVVRVVGGSGGVEKGMSTERSMALGGRRRRTSRWYVLGRDHCSSCEESVDDQKVCPRKGA